MQMQSPEHKTTFVFHQTKLADGGLKKQQNGMLNLQIDVLYSSLSLWNTIHFSTHIWTSHYNSPEEFLLNADKRKYFSIRAKIAVHVCTCASGPSTLNPMAFPLLDSWHLNELHLNVFFFLNEWMNEWKDNKTKTQVLTEPAI